VVPPQPGTGRATLPIDEDGLPVALVVHDAGLQDDPRLAAAVELATRLATANADLRARVRERRGELAASRGRLVRAADEEREHLASLLRVGPQARLTGLLNALRGIPDPTPDVDAAAARVAETLEDLGRWERGLHPRDLQQGLRPALDNLAAASRIPVTVTVSGARVPPVIEAAIYYVCGEALANVAKHSAATRVTVTVASDDDEVTVEVTDDGTGGADPDMGTGLRGVRDRLEAFGGMLTVTATPGSGTRLSGMVPLSLGVSSLDLGERAPSEDRIDAALAIRGTQVAEVGQEEALPVEDPGARQLP
jgi:signal transduction histidine kinase